MDGGEGLCGGVSESTRVDDVWAAVCQCDSAQLSGRRLSRPDGLCGCGGEVGVCRSCEDGCDRWKRRRVADGLDGDADDAVQGGGGAEGHRRLVELVVLGGLYAVSADVV